MNWFARVLTPALMLAGFSAGAVSLAQPPGGDNKDRKGPQDKKDGPDTKRGPMNPMGPGGPRVPEKADAAVEAWLKVLVEKMNDPHDVVRESARAGIVSIGRPAIPMLHKLSESDDSAKATAARKLIGMIEQSSQRGGFPGGPMGPGRGPGFGPIGPGGPFGPGGPGGFGRPGGPDGRPGEGNDRDNPRGRPMGPDEPRNPGPGDRPRGENRPDNDGARANPLERALASLDLNEKQKDQLKAIMDRHHKRVEELMDKARAGGIQREQAGQVMAELNEKIQKELKEFLTADQIKKLEAVMNSLRPGDRPARP